MSDTVNFKYNEDVHLTNAIEHIRKTYSQHYVGETDEIQTVDVWKSLGSLEDTSRDTAIKYLMRFGKKNGKNLDDLYKAIHYIVYMIDEVNRKAADVQDTHSQ